MRGEQRTRGVRPRRQVHPSDSSCDSRQLRDRLHAASHQGHRGRLAPAGLVALSPSSAYEGVSSPPLRSASIRTSPSLLVASSAFTRRHLPPGRAEEESCQAQPRCESSEIYDGECRKLAAAFLDDRNLREHKQLTIVSKWQQKLHVASISPVAM